MERQEGIGLSEASMDRVKEKAVRLDVFDSIGVKTTVDTILEKYAGIYVIEENYRL